MSDAAPQIAHEPVVTAENADREGVGRAMQIAWGIYLALGLLPAAFSVLGIWVSLLAESSDPDLSLWFMIAGSVWLSIAIPVALLIRRAAFSAYYDGGLVSPANFLRGSIPLWIAVVSGGLIGQVGWIVSRTPVVSSLVAVCALVVYLVFHPTGHAMTRPVGGHDDPALYEEPT